VIAHIVLFRPRADLSAQARQDLVAALERALREIPHVRRARVGRRVTHGREYEQLMRTDFEYGAVIDFDDVASLKAYLEHPAHDEIGRRFFEAFEETLIYDYEMKDGAAGLAGLLNPA
jgi:hypothetical protein